MDPEHDKIISRGIWCFILAVRVLQNSLSTDTAVREATRAADSYLQEYYEE